MVSLKATTAKHDERNLSSEESEIQVYCGPHHDAEKVIKIGKDIVHLSRYQSRLGFIFFKTDLQSASLYKVAVGDLP